MLTDLGCVLYGVLGGLMGGLTVFITVYIHYNAVFKNYFYNKEHFKTRMMVNGLEDQVNMLRTQMMHVNKELYDRFCEDGYK